MTRHIFNGTADQYQRLASGELVPTAGTFIATDLLPGGAAMSRSGAAVAPSATIQGSAKLKAELQQLGVKRGVLKDREPGVIGAPEYKTWLDEWHVLDAKITDTMGRLKAEVEREQDAAPIALARGTGTPADAAAAGYAQGDAWKREQLAMRGL